MTTAPSRSAKLSGEARGPRYAGSLVALHWLIALGIIGVLAPGLYMLRLPKGLPVKAALLNFHKSLGLTVFLLVLLRIVVRVARSQPPLPPMRPWQRAAARTTQVLLYVGMIVMPLCGYLGSSFNRYGTRFWGPAAEMGLGRCGLARALLWRAQGDGICTNRADRAARGGRAETSVD
jgi:cytochrome b561